MPKLIDIQIPRWNGISIKRELHAFADASGKAYDFTINSQSTKPLSTRVEAVNNMNKPKDIIGLKYSLGIINFYRKFTPNTASI